MVALAVRVLLCCLWRAPVKLGLLFSNLKDSFSILESSRSFHSSYIIDNSATLSAGFLNMHLEVSLFTFTWSIRLMGWFQFYTHLKQETQFPLAVGTFSEPESMLGFQGQRTLSHLEIQKKESKLISLKSSQGRCNLCEDLYKQVWSQ